MRRPPPERVDEPLRWLRANGHELAPLTGTDTRALLAIAACWRLYFSSDASDAVLRAVVELLGSMQPKCWPFAKALIPWAGDWSHEDPIWERVRGVLDGRAELRTADRERKRPIEHPAPAPVSEADRHRSAIAFVMAALSDRDLDDDQKRLIREKWRRTWPDRTPPWESSDRDPKQCRGDNDDGSPCRRDVVAGAGLCPEHLLATVKRCKCNRHPGDPASGPCTVALDDDHPSGLCFACRKRCAQ